MLAPLVVRAGGLAYLPAVPGAAARAWAAVLVLAFEQGILEQELLKLLVQFKCRQLQQPDRLLQLRRQREVLRKLELEEGFMRGARPVEESACSGQRRKFSPRYTFRTSSL